MKSLRHSRHTAQLELFGVQGRSPCVGSEAAVAPTGQGAPDAGAGGRQCVLPFAPLLARPAVAVSRAARRPGCSRSQQQRVRNQGRGKRRAALVAAMALQLGFDFQPPPEPAPPAKVVRLDAYRWAVDSEVIAAIGGGSGEVREPEARGPPRPLLETYKIPSDGRGYDRAAVSKLLADQGFTARATRLWGCGELLITQVCRPFQHANKPVPQWCEDKLACPTCARRHSAKAAARVRRTWAKLPKQRGYRTRVVTLTLRRGGTYRQDYEHFQKSFRRLRDRLGRLWPNFKRYGGGFRSVEVGETGGKLHVHMLVYMPWLDVRKLSALWKECTAHSGREASYIVHISEARGPGAVREVAKYVTKFSAHTPAELVDIGVELRGVHLQQTWGVCYGLDEPEPKWVPRCETCGSTDLLTSMDRVAHWARGPPPFLTDGN